MAERLPPEKQDAHGSLTKRDKLKQSVSSRLLEQTRIENKQSHPHLEKDMERYPVWNEHTISNLHNLFFLFVQRNEMLNFDGFSAILDNLGDESTCEYRKQKFDEGDRNKDGLINYSEYLDTIYNFNEQDGNTLTGLAKLCYDAAENAKFVSGLSVADQLQYGFI